MSLQNLLCALTADSLKNDAKLIFMITRGTVGRELHYFTASPL